MGRRKKKRRRSKEPIPLLATLPAVMSAFVDPLQHAMPEVQSGDFMAAAQKFSDRLSENFLGIWITQPQAGFVGFQRPLLTYGSILAGVAGSKLMTKLGVNRRLKKVPFLGKYVKL